MKGKPKGRTEPRLFAKDIKQWVNTNILDHKYEKETIYGGKFGKNKDNLASKDKLCGICMSNLVVFGLDFSLKCFHAICWCCTLRLRYLLKSKECPFCKNTIETLFFTSNPRYFEYLIDDSLEGVADRSLDSDKQEGMNIIEANLGHPKLEQVPKSLIDEKIGVIYESFACRWVFERILEYRCWFPNCRPKFPTKDSEDLHNNLKSYKNTKALGEHLFQDHHVKCCYVCIEKRKTMLLPEHYLYGVKDLSRHLKKGEMFLKPPILPHISCPICKVWCLDKEDFSDHVRNEHFSCQICEEKELSRQSGLFSESSRNEETDLNENNQEGVDELDDEEESTNRVGAQESNSLTRENRLPKITYVYRDYQALKEHWRQKHYPCDHENCMFIVFENESELIFHKATHHSAVNRRGNVTVPIVNSYRQQSQRRVNQLNSSQTTNQRVSNPIDISTPSLCAMDELSNTILTRIKREKPLLWRLVLIHDLNKCIQVVGDEITVKLGLEEKCRDFSSWSLQVINDLFSRNETMIGIIQKLGSTYIKREISAKSFIIEMVALLWGSSHNHSNNTNILQGVKKQFKSIATSPSSFKIFFSPIPEPITIFEDTLKERSGTYKRIPAQLVDRILAEEANWSLLYSDVISMILIALILGLPNIENRRELIKALTSLKDDIQEKNITIISNTSFPRFSFGNLQSSIEIERLKIHPQENTENQIQENINKKQIKQKFISFEKLIKPDEMLISQKVTFLESLNSFLTACFSKISLSQFSEFLPEASDKEKIFDKFKILIGSQTSTEINALSSLYQHTSSLVSSANTIERILGLRAPFYRLAMNTTTFPEDSQTPSTITESLAHRQWLNICTKAFNKICLYDVEIILIYCKACIKTLNDPNFLLLEKQKEELYEKNKEENSSESAPKTVNAHSGVISHSKSLAPSLTSLNSLKINTSGNWTSKTYLSSNSSAPKTVIASSSPIQSGTSFSSTTVSSSSATSSSYQPTTNKSNSIGKTANYAQALKSKESTAKPANENESKPKGIFEFPELISKGENKGKARMKPENPPKWVCILCTHVNSGTRNRCQICSTRK
ncbi:ring finger domain-containing protein [Cryptosporidium parvum]